MAIEVNNATKRYDRVSALDDVSVTFGGNKIYGLLGNNGAGKSTLLNLITNRVFANEGRILIDGMDARNNDRALGRLFMMGETNLYPDGMRVRGALQATARFYPDFDMEKAGALSERFHLDLRKKITGLSTGYASIFRLVLGLSVNTPYLLLDEPVLGLDAQHRDMFYRLLMEEYALKPRTVVVSTHLIAEVESIVEHVVIIRDGRIVADLPTEELLSRAHSVSGPAGLVDAYLAGHTVLSQSALGGLKTACVQGAPDDAPEGVEIGRVALQDYFVSLMNSEEESK